MPRYKDASPKIQVRLYKAISRSTVDNQTAVSARYSGKDEFVDLTPFLDENSSVVTTKGVREAAGVFSITFSDRPHQSVAMTGLAPPSSLETVYGLVEPMDMIEIRMWCGIGPTPAELPIKMRGFIGDINRSQVMTESGIPARAVVISGHDYGKVWQMLQVIFLAAYAEGKPLLTTYAFSELFGDSVDSVEKASDFIHKVMNGVVNPYLKKFVPPNSPMPKEIKLDDITVKYGVITLAQQNMQGAIYDIMKTNGDVGIWNELYVEDRQDGVHCVYRATPAMHITKPPGAAGKLIQDDSPTPPFVTIPDEDVVSISTGRSDNNIANFYWVFSVRADLNNEIYRKTAAISSSDPTASIREYPNAAEKYYGIRTMHGETQMGETTMINHSGGQLLPSQEKREKKYEDWITNRRRLMVEMNRDNVVFERGTAKVKGGPMRPDGKEHMKAGDYAVFDMGNLKYDGYVVQITDEFIPYRSYTTTLAFERGTGFVERIKAGGSPWLTEQAS